MSKKIALFPGTFDPITLGHIDIVHRSISLFDKMYVSVGVNSSKSTMFSVEKRMGWIKDIFKDIPNIQVSSFFGLTVDYATKISAKYIVRGIRYVSDFEYEKSITDANRSLNPEIETIILTSEPKFSSVASTIVREIIRNNGDASMFVPKEVIQTLEMK